MKIRSLTGRSGALAPLGRIEFHPGMNVIRGPNGVGKTTVLEYASFLGHLSALAIKTLPNELPQVELELAFGDADRAFVEWIRQLAADNPLRERFRAALTEQGIGHAIFDRAIALPPVVTIKIYLIDLHENQIKAALVDEHQLGTKVAIAAFGPDGQASVELAAMLQAIIAWSRPRRLQPAAGTTDLRWSIAPRTLATRSGEVQPPCHAPVVFYLNTDMYDFGIGLDIRESPKNLRSMLAELLVERLQLIGPDNVPMTSLNLLRELQKGATYSLAELRQIQSSWVRVFNEDHTLNELSVRRTGTGIHEQNDFEWKVSIAARSEASTFVSSGENQALFVLSMIEGLAKPGSCMLFDEPELHLSFWSGSSLVKLIADECAARDAQAIVVTHLPHLHRERINCLDHARMWELEASDKDGDAGYRAMMGGIRLVYINNIGGKEPKPAYDAEAVILAARESQNDVMDVVNGLRLTDTVPIIPWPNLPALSWDTFKRKLGFKSGK